VSLTRKSTGRAARLAVSALGLASVLALATACGGSTPPPAPAAPPPPAPAAPPPSSTPPPPPPAAAPAPDTKTLRIWLSGYSWQDNTPPGSAEVGEPVLHQVAGGQGTFADPITVAVPGHQGAMAWSPGTKFYLPTVQRYVIVEDSGAAPQPSGTQTHLDMWIGGQGATKSATDDCEDALTGRVPAQLNPSATMPVIAGPIWSDGKCNIPASTLNDQ
jgi:hypothetical protein